MTDRTVFVARFVAEPAPTPAVVRFRHLLKLALRACGLRCVYCEVEMEFKGDDQPRYDRDGKLMPPAMSEEKKPCPGPTTT